MSSASRSHQEGHYNGNAAHDRDKIAIVISRWNSNVTEAMAKGAAKTLEAHGVKSKNIKKYYVPGSFELPLAARHLASLEMFDAIICLGCIIKGDTKHNEYISQAVANALMNVGLKNKLPVIFGVLTPDSLEQAIARAGGPDGTAPGNKGDEAAVAALEMIDLLSIQAEELSFMGRQK